VGHAGDRLLLRAGIAFGEHVHLAVAIGEPRRHGATDPVHLDADPDHVGLAEPFLDVLGQLRVGGLDDDGNLDLADDLAVEDERGEERAGLVEPCPLHAVGLDRQIHAPDHPTDLGPPSIHQAAGRPVQVDLLGDHPGADLPRPVHAERQCLSR
jgi:hypothetical protein